MNKMIHYVRINVKNIIIVLVIKRTWSLIINYDRGHPVVLIIKLQVYIYTYTHTHIYMYIYMYTYTLVV